MERIHKDKLPLEHPFKVALKIYRDRLLLVLAIFLFTLLISIVFGIAKTFPLLTVLFLSSSLLLYLILTTTKLLETVFSNKYDTFTIEEVQKNYEYTMKKIKEIAKITATVKEIEDNNKIEIIKQMSPHNYEEIMNIFERTLRDISKSGYLSLEEKQIFISQIDNLCQNLMDTKFQKIIIKKQGNKKFELEEF